MNKSELIPLLQELGIRPSKKLGQNFLIDPNFLAFILKQAAVKSNEVILEVGPGTGNLSNGLVATAAKVIAIEYDCRLSQYLKKKYQHNPSITILQADACRVDYQKLPDLTPPFSLIANLPYAITSPLMNKFLTTNFQPERMFFTVQREMAERLAAQPRQKAYGSLSVRFQAVYKVEILRILSPKVFWPEPDVHSALLSCHASKSSRFTNLKTLEQFNMLVKHAFSQRRKKLMNTLSALFDPYQIKICFKQLQLAESIRAEAVSVEEFIRLNQCFTKFLRHRNTCYRDA